MNPMILPIVDETWEDHFINNGWSTPQDQIDAGYPIFCQPTAATAQFIGTLDVGDIIDSSVLVNLALNLQDIVAGVVFTPTISLSDDNVSFTDYAGVYSVFASGFRYVKITIDATSADPHAIRRLNEVRVTVAVEEIQDAGDGSALAADSGGTTVTFNKPFNDVISITVTAKYQVAETKGITAVYDFVDIPNPTTFKVLLYSNLTGSRIDGAFSWQARGS
jgi:hypothetical protein